METLEGAAGDLPPSIGALIGSEGPYRWLVETLPFVTYVDRLDDQASSMYVSPQIEGLLGYTPAEWVADPGLFRARLHPDDHERVAAEHARWYDEGGEILLRYRLLARDDRVVWVDDHGRVDATAEGVAYARGFLVDVTAQVLAEADRAAAQLRYRRLVESLPLVTYSDAPDRLGTSIYLSPQVERLLGYSLDEWRRDPNLWQRILHPDDRPRVEATIARTIAGEPASVEYRLHHRDGRVVWVLDEATPEVRDGRVVGVDGFLVDLTARREAEERIRASEALFRSLIENAHEMIGVIDPVGTVREAHGATERILGYRPDELLGRNVFGFLHPDDVPPAADRLAAILEGPDRLATVEVRFRTAEGGMVPLEVVGQNLLDVPAVAGIVLNARDITERLRAEAELRRSEEQLRESAKMDAIGRLAGGVAHDFNNILTVVIANAHEVAEHPGLDDEARAAMQDIIASAERAATLTAQLLAFARRQPVDPRPLDLGRLVESLEGMLRSMLGADISLRIDVHPDARRVLADRAQIEQVVVGLAVNARDAMAGGGTLTFEVGPAGPSTRLRVTDTGQGMDEGTLGRIFEPFFTTKEPGRGPGLGLAMTHGIIERSGGAITAGSTPGAGTTFEILLPCAGDESGPTRPHVLLVEDDTTVRAVVVRALDRAGYAVTAAEPAEALALLDGPAPVDVLVTDVVMAGIGGVALAEHATTRRPGLPVLFVSGHPRAALTERGVPDDAHVLEKPFGMSRLCSSVEQVLATGSADTTGS